jgi:hypothetical protein
MYIKSWFEEPYGIFQTLNDYTFLEKVFNSFMIEKAGENFHIYQKMLELSVK